MKSFLTKLRDVATAGFFFLLPVYVVLIIVTKAWTSLSSLGTQIAAMFGMKSILGVGSSTVFSGLLLIIIWIGCGLLARFSLMSSFSKAIEKTLSKYIPGYETYKSMAEEKFQKKVKILPYRSALIKQQEYWQPAYVVEQDGEGNYVIFLPDTPDTNKGHVLLAQEDQVKLLPSVTADELDTSLKKRGKGLLTEHGIRNLKRLG